MDKILFWTTLFLMLGLTFSDAFSEQSCCGYDMPTGIENNFGCHGGNCVWWAVYKRNDLSFMTMSPETADCPDCWVNDAIDNGYEIGTTPRKGAIAVYPHGFKWSKYGHVAYVESVNGKKYTVSEMGYDSWDCVREKTRRAGWHKVKFIYGKKAENKQSQ